MPPQAAETFSTFGVLVLCVVLAIMALTIFFKTLNWLSDRATKPEAIAIRGVLKKDTWVKVYTSGTETFERVRFIGFTNAESMKNHLPHELNGMVILEDPEGRRFVIRAKAIHKIEIAPPGDNLGATKV